MPLKAIASFMTMHNFLCMHTMQGELKSLQLAFKLYMTDSAIISISDYSPRA